MSRPTTRYRSGPKRRFRPPSSGVNFHTGAGWRGDPGRPLGLVSRRVEEVLTYSRPHGVAKAIEQTREETAESERQTVAAKIADLVRESGLSRTEFASRIGTPASRLSTSVTRKVTPCAGLLVRMRHVAERERAAQGCWHCHRRQAMGIGGAGAEGTPP